MLNLATIDDLKDVVTKEYVDERALPTVSSSDNGKILVSSNGTWIVNNPIGMVILSYGNSTWSDFLTAYKSNRVIYCRASSNTNPATGTQGRMAFMAYVNNGDNPTEVEFQYYRSVNTHSDSQQGDQVFVYKITSAGTWTVTARNSFTKISAGDGLTSTYSNGVLTLKNKVPTGGSTGQVLTKVSGTNYDLAWTTPSGGGGSLPSGGTAGQFLKKNSSTEGDASWADLPEEIMQVTVTGINGSYSSDKTFLEISDAITNGKNVFARYQGYNYVLTYCDGDNVFFMRYYLLNQSIIEYVIRISKQLTPPDIVVVYDVTLEVPSVPVYNDGNILIGLSDSANSGYDINCEVQDIGNFFVNDGLADFSSVTLIYNKQWYDSETPTNGKSEIYHLCDRYTTNQYDSTLGEYVFIGYLIFKTIVREVSSTKIKTITLSDPLWDKNDFLETATVTMSEETISGGGGGGADIVVVNITQSSGGGYTADKTYAELYSALTNGTPVFALDGYMMFPAFKYQQNQEILFYGEWYDLSGHQVYYDQYVISSNNNITFSFGQVPTLPAVSIVDNGKFLRVVNGFWSAENLPSANGVSF